jgi:mannose-6-phosphate isomerase
MTISTQAVYPLRLQASLHETIWGGRRLERDSWKHLPEDETLIGEAWETEISTVVQNGPCAGQTLGELVTSWGSALLGEQAVIIFGQRFPLLAKFIDANAQLSLQVHPKDDYAARYEGGKLGKTEFWYILAAEPGASIVHGFQQVTDRTQVQKAIADTELEAMLHEEPVQSGDVIFVPAGTVHAIGSGVLLYELQEYSDVTYRMYDYGRLDASGRPRELHIERSLDVSRYAPSDQIKMRPVMVQEQPAFIDRCLVACRYFVTHELRLRSLDGQAGVFSGQTTRSCTILSSLNAEVQVRYHGNQSVNFSRGETVVLPAALGDYQIVGTGALLFSYVPASDDPARQLWNIANPASAS